MNAHQDSTELVKQMADSMNLSVPEFEKMMREEHGLVPPEDDDEYYDPPQRKMSVNAVSPEAARRRADELRQVLRTTRLWFLTCFLIR